jgi:large subunit ribosomal protein L10
MNRDEKAQVIAEVVEQIRESEAIIALDYRGISVPQAAELRTRLRDADATFRVVKNRLSSLAADEAGVEALKGVLEGPTALTFVRGDAAVAAKAITQFQRDAPNLEIKGGTLNGDALTAEQFTAIARLPGREQLYAQLVGVVAAPLTGLVRGLGSMVQGLASQLEQIREQGLVGGGAGEPAAEAAPAEAEAAEEPAAEAPAEEPPAEQEQEQETTSDETPGGSRPGGEGGEAPRGDGTEEG